MRKHIITFLILLMAALPVWSASMVCHHVQKMPQTMNMHTADHHCCHDKQVQPEQTAGDTCHCDQFQHGQFILSLPTIAFITPTNRFIPPVLSLQPLPERTDVLYRPPIA
jgi:hypothetical protein